MAVGDFKRLRTDYDTRVAVYEWDLDQTVANPEPAMVPQWAEIYMQLLQIISGSPTITFEGSSQLKRELAADFSDFVGAQMNSLLTQVPISLTAAGAHDTAAESPVILRPVLAGTARVIVRVKWTAGYPGY